MSELRTGFLTMTTIILISIGFVMVFTGLYHKRTTSPCIREVDGSFISMGLLLLIFPQLVLYAICCRSKRLFSTYFYAMIFVTLVVSGYSIKCFVYNNTFGIAENPAEDGRTAKQLVGRLVTAEKLARATDCIIHTHDCNFNASKNSNVWRFCCTQPDGCGDSTMFDKPGEWSWQHQHQPNQVREECSYTYCPDCKGCELSILKAIVYQWKYLSMFSYPAFFFLLITFAIAWSIKDSTFQEPEDYKGYYT